MISCILHRQYQTKSCNNATCEDVIMFLQTLINLTDTMLSKLHETNSSTFAWVETTSNAFGNVLTKSEYVADKSVVRNGLYSIYNSKC